MNAMPARVLAAFDFAEPSLEALRQGRALAHGLGGTLAACHVLPAVHDLSLIVPQAGIIVEADQIAEVERTRNALVEHARTTLGLELGQVFVERGKPYAEIVRRAETYGADFIVVGTHGRAGLARVVLGSVAERVARHAHCSVLVARPAHRTGVVLAATDLSDPSLPAIAAGAAAAERSGAQLVVVSVLDWAMPGAAAATGMVSALPALPTPELTREIRDALRSTLEHAMTRVEATGEARVLEGSPASAIVDCAEELGAELVVVGTHGRTGLTRLALGSVAERVIRAAGCSVLAVRLARHRNVDP
jgi:nucleotide-binding universal stress UspA family protein